MSVSLWVQHRPHRPWCTAPLTTTGQASGCHAPSLGGKGHLVGLPEGLHCGTLPWGAEPDPRLQLLASSRSVRRPRGALALTARTETLDSACLSAAGEVLLQEGLWVSARGQEDPPWRPGTTPGPAFPW